MGRVLEFGDATNPGIWEFTIKIMRLTEPSGGDPRILELKKIQKLQTKEGVVQSSGSLFLGSGNQDQVIGISNSDILGLMTHHQAWKTL